MGQAARGRRDTSPRSAPSAPWRRNYDPAALAESGIAGEDRAGRRRFYHVAGMSVAAVAAVAAAEVDPPRYLLPATCYLRLTEEATRRPAARRPSSVRKQRQRVRPSRRYKVGIRVC